MSRGKFVKIKNSPGYFREVSTDIIYFRSDTVRHKKLNGGKPIKKSTEEKTISKAKLFIENYFHELGGKNTPTEKRKRKGIKNPLLDDLWNDIVEEKSLEIGESTLRIYKKEWRIALYPFWGSLTVGDVSKQKVVDFQKWYLKNHSKRTFFNTRKTLVMILNYLKRENYLFTDIKVPKLDEVIAKRTKKVDVGRVYTEKELKALLNAAQSKKQDKLYDCVFLGVLFASRMGLRKNEFLSIKWDDIDFINGSVKVWRKNKYWAELLMPKILLSELKKRKAIGRIYVMSSARSDEKHLASQIFDRIWREVKVLAGIRNATSKNAARIHDLRHTFATKTADDNWNPLIACEYLDMSLKVYQDTYVHVSIDMMKGLIENSFGGEI